MFKAIIVDWDSHGEVLRSIREKVFVVEQRLAYHYAEDTEDPFSIHALVEDKLGIPVAAGRIKASGHLGRVAVLMPWRHNGIGHLLIDALVQAGWRQGHFELHLHALLEQKGFYQAFNFQVDGPVFMDGGRPQQRMIVRSRARKNGPASDAQHGSDADEASMFRWSHNSTA